MLPYNEFDPVWKKPVVDASGEFPALSVKETASPGSNIGIFSAVDLDAGIDGEIVYLLSSVVSGESVT